MSDAYTPEFEAFCDEHGFDYGSAFPEDKNEVRAAWVTWQRFTTQAPSIPDGTRIDLPVSVEHARAMAHVATMYMKEHDSAPANMSAGSVPAAMGMLRCLQYVECVYRLNCVSEGEPSSTLKYMQDVIAANAQAPSVPADFPYQKTFNAIAAATSVCGGQIAVSVAKFVESFNGAPQANAKSTMTTERIQKVAETLGEAIAGESDYNRGATGTAKMKTANTRYRTCLK